MSQEKPVKSEDSQPVFPSIIEDLREREKTGIETYGQSLHTFNGRSSLQDAYEEVLDLAVYLKQMLMERKAFYAKPGRVIPVQGEPAVSSVQEIIEEARKVPSYSKYDRTWLDQTLGTVTIYLSGPMTGVPEYNYPAFRKYTEKYRTQGFRVISPHELDERDKSAPGPDGKLKMAYGDYLRRDVAVLLNEKVTRMYLMPGWQKSRGASLEKHIAETIGIELYDAETGEPWKESVLQEAQRLVHGDRGQHYGHPIFDLTRTADMTTALLRNKLRPGARLEPEEIAKVMMAVKLSRETHAPKRDNRVDIPGYAEVLDMIIQWREENPGKDPREFYDREVR